MEIGLFSQSAGYFEATAPDGAELISSEDGVLKFRLLDEAEHTVATLSDAVIVPLKPDGPHEWKDGEWVAITIPEPTPDEKRAAMPNLTARQLRLGLLSLGKLDAVPAAISALPSPDREQAEIEWQYASEFRRLHPLIVQLIPILGLTDDQVDAVWLQFAQV